MRGIGRARGPRAGRRATRQRLAALEEQVGALSAQVEALVEAALTDWQFVNLEKIVSGRFGRFTLSAGLRSDLQTLVGRGYVQVRDPLPDRGDELCGYVRATEAGRHFLAVRRSCARPIPTLRAGEVAPDAAAAAGRDDLHA